MVNQGAGSTGACCLDPTNWPLFLKMGLCPNSHIGSVMSTLHGCKVAKACAWGPKAMPHPQVPFPSGGLADLLMDELGHNIIAAKGSRALPRPEWRGPRLRDTYGLLAGAGPGSQRRRQTYWRQKNEEEPEGKYPQGGPSPAILHTNTAALTAHLVPSHTSVHSAKHGLLRPALSQ